MVLSMKMHENKLIFLDSFDCYIYLMAFVHLAGFHVPLITKITPIIRIIRIDYNNYSVISTDGITYKAIQFPARVANLDTGLTNMHWNTLSLQ